MRKYFVIVYLVLFIFSSYSAPDQTFVLLLYTQPSSAEDFLCTGLFVNGGFNQTNEKVGSSF